MMPEKSNISTIQSPVKIEMKTSPFTMNTNTNTNTKFSQSKSISIWLFSCAALVFGMVVIGGLTRLTKSGLSMVEWKVTTIMPPIGEHEWELEFEKYKLFPEYQK
jgi:hypothetical protein